MDGGDLLTLPPVVTCDEDVLPALRARKICKLYFYLGFACLPWFWACNVWLFAPDFWHGDRDLVIAKCEWVYRVELLSSGNNVHA